MPLHILDYTPYTDDDGKLKRSGRLQGSVRFGSHWPGEMDAQAALMDRLKKLLNDRFTLVRNFTLPDIEIPIPIILIGPTGLWVWHATDMSGFFAARGKEWLTLENRTGEYEASSPNPLMHTLLVTRALNDFMQRSDLVGIQPQNAILFTDPGIDITTDEPAVRIVMIDALNRYLASVTHAENTLSKEQTSTLVRMISEHHKSTREEEEAQENEPVLRFKFSTAQWVVVATLIIINVIGILFLLAVLATN
jgi:hypothetical protein